MVVKINDAYLEKLFEGKVAGKPRYSNEVINKYIKTVMMLQNADSIIEIRALRGLNFEALSGKMKGLYSVRVDQKYRLLFSIIKDEMVVEGIISIESLSNHYQ
jgi:toxin HigB-1